MAELCPTMLARLFSSWVSSRRYTLSLLQALLQLLDFRVRVFQKLLRLMAFADISNRINENRAAVGFQKTHAEFRWEFATIFSQRKNFFAASAQLEFRPTPVDRIAGIARFAERRASKVQSAGQKFSTAIAKQVRSLRIANRT